MRGSYTWGNRGKGDMISKKEFEHFQNEEDLFTNQILSLYVDTFSMTIKNQIQYALLTCLMGVNLMATRNNLQIQTQKGGSNTEDARIPIIYFSDSGTGKGMGINFFFDIFGDRGVGLRIISPSQPTPEKLVGSFDEEQHKRNLRAGVNEDSPEEEKIKKKYLNPVIPGYLESYDLVIMDECEPYFRDKDGKILRMVRRALDTYGSMNNYLQSETLKNRVNYGYFCKCNIVMLSYYITGIEEKIVTNGIFQRTVCYLSKYTEKEKEGFLKFNNINIDEHMQRKRQLITELQKIEKYINSLTAPITMLAEAEQEICRFITMKFQQEHERNDEVGNLVDSFLVRMFPLITKLSCAFALLDVRNVITIRDVRQATELASDAFNSVKVVIVEKEIMTKRLQKYSDDVKRNIGKSVMSKGDVETIMSTVWGITPRAVRKRLKKIQHIFRDVEDKRLQKKGNMRFVCLK